MIGNKLIGLGREILIYKPNYTTDETKTKIINGYDGSVNISEGQFYLDKLCFG